MSLRFGKQAVHATSRTLITFKMFRLVVCDIVFLGGASLRKKEVHMIRRTFVIKIKTLKGVFILI